MPETNPSNNLTALEVVFGSAGCLLTITTLTYFYLLRKANLAKLTNPFPDLTKQMHQPDFVKDAQLAELYPEDNFKTSDN